eukprot:scaffold952_cov249-Pinguiococcus_pyrenoidosus.AAC.9
MARSILVLRNQGTFLRRQTGFELIAMLVPMQPHRRFQLEKRVPHPTTATQGILSREWLLSRYASRSRTPQHRKSTPKAFPADRLSSRRLRRRLVRASSHPSKPLFRRPT